MAATPANEIEVSLLLLKGARLARIGDGVVADVAKGLEEFLRPCNRWVVFHKRLLVREADGNLVDPGQATQRLLDRAGAQ